MISYFLLSYATFATIAPSHQENCLSTGELFPFQQLPSSLKQLHIFQLPSWTLGGKNRHQHEAFEEWWSGKKHHQKWHIWRIISFSKWLHGDHKFPKDQVLGPLPFMAIKMAAYLIFMGVGVIRSHHHWTNRRRPWEVTSHLPGGHGGQEVLAKFRSSGSAV